MSGAEPQRALKKLDGKLKLPKQRKGISWDEVTIAEHDKERGTRMKIEEPDTPYHQGADSGHDTPQAMEEDVVMQDGAGPPAIPLRNAQSLPSVMQQNSRTAVSPDELINKLVAHKARKEAERAARGGESGDSSCEPSPAVGPRSGEEEKKKKAFADKRKGHYNEFQLLRQMREAGKLEDEEDDDD
ncbi:unnamed protein product [Vitrella brassicaformis CCMP3155]|uniref:Protein phosphatase inhibitor 2 n=2 Tax=Vitrella brassicaformis TaxID=1169539 RepID=A0A0G4H1G4_VITBC|nr:unnamed protein product [Vitrella brassicaformis CCMP3155]|eukprot:CEM37449.1 unnamed protein product [Vitrella brassicaformis CCMP3155]